MFFSRTRQVTVVGRPPKLDTMSQYLIDRISETANIDVLVGTVVSSVSGSGRLERITLMDVATNAAREVDGDAMFVFIGSSPQTQMVADLVERDAQGFILTGRDLLVDGHWPKSWTVERDPFLFETSVPGIFAAGDARRGSSKRGGRGGRGIGNRQHDPPVFGDGLMGGFGPGCLGCLECLSLPRASCDFLCPP